MPTSSREDFVNGLLGQLLAIQIRQKGEARFGQLIVLFQATIVLSLEPLPLLRGQGL